MSSPVVKPVDMNEPVDAAAAAMAATVTASPPSSAASEASTISAAPAASSTSAASVASSSAAPAASSTPAANAASPATPAAEAASSSPPAMSPAPAASTASPSSPATTSPTSTENSSPPTSPEASTSSPDDNPHSPSPDTQKRSKLSHDYYQEFRSEPPHFADEKDNAEHNALQALLNSVGFKPILDPMAKIQRSKRLYNGEMVAYRYEACTMPPYMVRLGGLFEGRVLTKSPSKRRKLRSGLVTSNHVYGDGTSERAKLDTRIQEIYDGVDIRVDLTLVEPTQRSKRSRSPIGVILLEPSIQTPKDLKRPMSEVTTTSEATSPEGTINSVQADSTPCISDDAHSVNSNQTTESTSSELPVEEQGNDQVVPTSSENRDEEHGAQEQEVEPLAPSASAPVVVTVDETTETETSEITPPSEGTGDEDSSETVSTGQLDADLSAQAPPASPLEPLKGDETLRTEMPQTSPSSEGTSDKDSVETVHVAQSEPVLESCEQAVEPVTSETEPSNVEEAAQTETSEIHPSLETSEQDCSSESVPADQPDAYRPTQEPPSSFTGLLTVEKDDQNKDQTIASPSEVTGLENCSQSVPTAPPEADLHAQEDSGFQSATTILAIQNLDDEEFLPDVNDEEEFSDAETETDEDGDCDMRSDCGPKYAPGFDNAFDPPDYKPVIAHNQPSFRKGSFEQNIGQQPALGQQQTGVMPSDYFGTNEPSVPPQEESSPIMEDIEYASYQGLQQEEIEVMEEDTEDASKQAPQDTRLPEQNAQPSSHDTLGSQAADWTSPHPFQHGFFGQQGWVYGQQNYTLPHEAQTEPDTPQAPLMSPPDPMHDQASLSQINPFLPYLNGMDGTNGSVLPQSLLSLAQKYGVSGASQSYNANASVEQGNDESLADEYDQVAQPVNDNGNPSNDQHNDASPADKSQPAAQPETHTEDVPIEETLQKLSIDPQNVVKMSLEEKSDTQDAPIDANLHEIPIAPQDVAGGPPEESHATRSEEILPPGVVARVYPEDDRFFHELTSVPGEFRGSEWVQPLPVVNREDQQVGAFFIHYGEIRIHDGVHGVIRPTGYFYHWHSNIFVQVYRSEEGHYYLPHHTVAQPSEMADYGPYDDIPSFTSLSEIYQSIRELSPTFFLLDNSLGGGQLARELPVLLDICNRVEPIYDRMSDALAGHEYKLLGDIAPILALFHHIMLMGFNIQGDRVYREEGISGNGGGAVMWILRGLRLLGRLLTIDNDDALWRLEEEGPPSMIQREIRKQQAAAEAMVMEKAANGPSNKAADDLAELLAKTC